MSETVRGFSFVTCSWQFRY